MLLPSLFPMPYFKPLPVRAQVLAVLSLLAFLVSVLLLSSPIAVPDAPTCRLW